MLVLNVLFFQLFFNFLTQYRLGCLGKTTATVEISNSNSLYLIGRVILINFRGQYFIHWVKCLCCQVGVGGGGNESKRSLAANGL